MAIQLEDTKEWREQKTQEAKLRNLEQMRHQAAVAEVMSELQADPRWAVYGNHLQSILENYEREVKGYEQSLLGHEFLEPKKYVQLKISLATAKGAVNGIRIALNLAKSLIERGETAKG